MSSEKYTEGLGKRIKMVRQHLIISQSEFGKAIGKRHVDISKYERNEILPNAETLCRIFAKYDVNINWLLSGLGQMFIDKVPGKAEMVSDHAAKYDLIPEDIIILLQKNIELTDQIRRYDILKTQQQPGEKLKIKWIFEYD